MLTRGGRSGQEDWGRNIAVIVAKRGSHRCRTGEGRCWRRAHEPELTGRYGSGHSDSISSTVRSTSTCPPSGPTVLLSAMALYPPPRTARWVGT